MKIIKYQKKYHKKIIADCVLALEQGKTLVYPTDTSYGLACDATNFDAIIQIYRIKERNFQKPIHIIPPSTAYARKVTAWGKLAGRLAKKFWPGPLTLVLSIKSGERFLKQLGAKTGNIGLRFPKNSFALDLVKSLKKPITTTSANPSKIASGGFDSYSAAEVKKQFKNKKFQPDIIIDAGKLPNRKPSTVVLALNNHIEILRPGPISQKQILLACS